MGISFLHMYFALIGLLSLSGGGWLYDNHHANQHWWSSRKRRPKGPAPFLQLMHSASAALGYPARGIPKSANRWRCPVIAGTPPPLSRIYHNSLDHLLIRRVIRGESHLARFRGPPRPRGTVALRARSGSRTGIDPALERLPQIDRPAQRFFPAVIPTITTGVFFCPDLRNLDMQVT